jgi:hypothetical protein
MRTALDVGNVQGAVQSLNEELDVAHSKELPSQLTGDASLFVLDRASLQQACGEFAWSKRDYEAADKAIDMLDLAHNAGDSIGEYMFSGASGRYQAPPYEKLMINTLNMLNYLETHDLNGARIEARRLRVMQKYYRDALTKIDEPILALGSALAGFVYEKSEDFDEALRSYDEVLATNRASSVTAAVRRIARRGAYRSPRINALLADESPVPEEDGADVLLVVGYGRVVPKTAHRIPIGLALTYYSSALSPTDQRAANEMAAQGLVSWINYPSLAPRASVLSRPNVRVDGHEIPLEDVLDVDRAAREEWKSVEGKVIVSAMTRLLVRTGVGGGIRVAAGKDSGWGFLASLVAQVTLTALDTPDTRSWETLPARVALARVRLAPGKHVVDMAGTGGPTRKPSFDVAKGEWAVVSRFVLR